MWRNEKLPLEHHSDSYYRPTYLINVKKSEWIFEEKQNIYSLKVLPLQDSY